MDLSKIIVPEDAVPKPLVTCTIEGILEESDLRELMLGVEAAAGEPTELDDPSDLKKIRERHHSVARMIATGLNQRMVSGLCGYTESYLSVLLNNPAMQELIELYRIQLGSASEVIAEKLRTVGMKALEQLDERIDKKELNNQELLSASKLGLDRAGHGPQSKQHIVREDHLFDHTELQRRNVQARQRNEAYIVPAEEVRQSLLPAPKEQKDETDGNLGSEGPELSEDRSLARGQVDGE